MSKTNDKVKVPKRLKIKDHMYILGVPDVDVKLGPGLYVLGRNMDEQLAIQLASPEFSHCVEVLPDEQPEEQLGAISEAPKATPGYVYSRKKQHDQELAAWERDHGKSVHKPEHLKQNE